MTSFRVPGAELSDPTTAPSGGQFPSSVAVNGDLVYVLNAGGDGLPSAAPVVTPSAGAVRFSFVVDNHGLVQVTEAGTGATSTYAVARDGGLRLLGSSAGAGLNALCWSIQVGGTVHGANAGSATLSAWSVPARGGPHRVGRSDHRERADRLAASADGRFLYVQESVDGTIGGYAVARDGSLTRIQTVTGLPAFGTTGMEGIAAG